MCVLIDREVLQDVETIFAMFDDDDSGAISLEEFLRVTTALRSRLRRVSHLRRTGMQSDKYVHPLKSAVCSCTTCMQAFTKSLLVVSCMQCCSSFRTIAACAAR